MSLFSRYFCSYWSVLFHLLSRVLQLITGKHCFLLYPLEQCCNTSTINQLWLANMNAVQSNQHQMNLSHSPSVYKQISEKRNGIWVPFRFYFVSEPPLNISVLKSQHSWQEKKLSEQLCFQILFGGQIISSLIKNKLSKGNNSFAYYEHFYLCYLQLNIRIIFKANSIITVIPRGLNCLLEKVLFEKNWWMIKY